MKTDRFVFVCHRPRYFGKVCYYPTRLGVLKKGAGRLFDSLAVRAR